MAYRFIAGEYPVAPSISTHDIPVKPRRKTRPKPPLDTADAARLHTLVRKHGAVVTMRWVLRGVPTKFDTSPWRYQCPRHGLQRFKAEHRRRVDLDKFCRRVRRCGAPSWLVTAADDERRTQRLAAVEARVVALQTELAELLRERTTLESV